MAWFRSLISSIDCSLPDFGAYIVVNNYFYYRKCTQWSADLCQGGSVYCSVQANNLGFEFYIMMYQTYSQCHSFIFIIG